MPEITTDAKIENLGALLEFVERACRDSGVAQSDVFAFRLAADEVCTNIINYGYAGREPGPITLAFSTADDRMVLTVGDRGRPFNPDDAPAPDLESSWEERQIGGLGLFLLQSMMDEVRYEADGGEGNRLTLVKRKAASST